MRKPACWFLVVLAASVSCSPPAEETRARSSADVPQDLALALLGGQSQGEEIFVGSAPAAVNSVVPIPSEARVAGGLIRNDGGTVVLEIDQALEGAIAQYGGLIEARDWEQAPDDPRGRGGFEPSPRPLAETWCTASHWMRVSGVSVGDRDYLRVRYYTREATGASPCATAEQRAQMAMGNFGLRFPSLVAPAGSQVLGGGGSGSTDRIARDVLVIADMDAEELFDHYALQLDQAGWDPTARISNDEMAIGRWAATDDMGNPAIGVFAVWAQPQPRNYRAWIRLERVRD